MEFINDNILQELFKRDEEKLKQYNINMAEDNLSNDSLDFESGDVYRLNINDGEIDEKECIKAP